MKKSLIFAAAVTAGMAAAPGAQAALAADAQLLMGPQTGHCWFNLGTYPDACATVEIPDGNYFAMDHDGSGALEESERVGITAGTDGGILLGVDQSALGAIDATWNYFGYPGNHIQAGTLSVTSAAGNSATINMSDWTVIWGIDPLPPLDPQPPIDLGTGADAIVTCGNTCENGDTYTLDYSALIPSGVFIGITYQLHMSGTISSVPIPTTVWLFGSGLIGLIGIARRKKA